jgi:hypothetical protein
VAIAPGAGADGGASDRTGHSASPKYAAICDISASLKLSAIDDMI